MGRRWIIPARAGFTTSPGKSRATRADHPRSRGVYPNSWTLSRNPSGSSPLARGLPGHGPGARPLPGIIPARAGFTQHISHTLPTHPDHPRSRGVYPRLTVAVSARWGSSPLARGLRGNCPYEWDVKGIIPARAGFTLCGPPATPATSDHPRSRGVYALGLQVLDDPGGSSPLARGLLLRGEADADLVRIIPARAGFTSQTGSTGPGHRDHPRSRGVYITPFKPRQRHVGSSPLARGLPVDGTLARNISGSSPLARGLLQDVHIVGVDNRIIPARAGFTRAHPQPC